MKQRSISETYGRIHVDCWYQLNLRTEIHVIETTTVLLIIIIRSRTCIVSTAPQQRGFPPRLSRQIPFAPRAFAPKRSRRRPAGFPAQITFSARDFPPLCSLGNPRRRRRRRCWRPSPCMHAPWPMAGHGITSRRI